MNQSDFQEDGGFIPVPPQPPHSSSRLYTLTTHSDCSGIGEARETSGTHTRRFRLLVCHGERERERGGGGGRGASFLLTSIMNVS